MSQNDFTIANQGFPAFRADLNSALQALASNNSGATEPSTMFANMWWYDSANNIMYIRNEDNDAWIKFAELDQANDKFVLSGTLQLDDGTVSAPALTFNSDTNMGIYRGGTDILKFVTAGTDAVTIDASQDVTLAGSLNFADNEKAIFGAGSDLQIYHDGASGASYIAETGASNLILLGTNFRVNNAGNTQSMIVADDGGYVKLHYAGAGKFETTSTGIDVTGTVVSDGMSTNTAGTSNFIAGVNAGNSIVSGGNYNVAVGDEAGTALTTGDNNVAIGFEAGKTINTASLNTLIGSYCGRLIDTGIENVGLGYNVLGADVKGSNSVAIGSKALQVQSFSGATSANNTAVGHNAGKSVTTGIQNTLIGSLAGDALSDADYNVAVGSGALSADTKGSRSVAIGYNALASQNFTSATQARNTAVGFSAGDTLTTGIFNTFFGYNAGGDLTDGERNILVGVDSAAKITTADDCIAIGYRSGGGNAASATTGHDNVCIGTDAGLVLTTGQFNTILGRSSGNAVTTGSSNILIGYECGTGGTPLNTGSENVIIGNGGDSGNGTQRLAIGHSVTTVGDNHFTFGKGSGNDRVYNQFTANASWTRVSDERYKKEITDNTDCGLAFINDLRPVTFKWKAKSEIDSSLPDYDANKTTADHTEKMYGLIAQEVKQALDNHNITDFAGHDIIEDSGIQAISQEMFIHPLIKAVQELSAKNDALEARIATLEGE